MKQELSTTNQTQVTDAQLISYLDTLGLTAKLTDQEKTAYIAIAKAFGLNPFKREIHVSKYGDQMAVITGYEVYIKRAERTGQLDGWTATTTGSVATKDLKATVTIYRKDRNHPFIWETFYDECVQTTREGNPTKFWQKGAFMTKKVCISQAFRLCFSDELAGIPYTSDEMPDQVTHTEDIPHVTIPDFKPVSIGSKAFTSAVKAMKEGKTFEEVEASANTVKMTFVDEAVKNALLNAVEEAA